MFPSFPYLKRKQTEILLFSSLCFDKIVALCLLSSVCLLNTECKKMHRWCKTKKKSWDPKSNLVVACVFWFGGFWRYFWQCCCCFCSQWCYISCYWFWNTIDITIFLLSMRNLPVASTIFWGLVASMTNPPRGGPRKADRPRIQVRTPKADVNSSRPSMST